MYVRPDNLGGHNIYIGNLMEFLTNISAAPVENVCLKKINFWKYFLKEKSKVSQHLQKY